MKWQDTQDIALALLEAYPDIEPRVIRFTDLHQWITTLPDFNDDPARSNEGILEAIQMAWLDEWQ